MSRFRIPLLILVLLAIAAGILAATGYLRPVYFMLITEARLAWRRQPLVLMRVAPIDKMNQVYIPAGEFTMGSDLTPYIGTTPHEVYLDAYWIDQFMVTNTMYHLCMNAGKCRPTAKLDTYLNDPAYADYPVHYTTWYDASDYCAFIGGRLATSRPGDAPRPCRDGRW